MIIYIQKGIGINLSKQKEKTTLHINPEMEKRNDQISGRIFGNSLFSQQ